MGKYARMSTHPGISDPEKLANLVVETWKDAVSTHADDMGANYLNGCKNANKPLMIARLAAWYRNVPGISAKYTEVFNRVRIDYRRSIGKA